MNWYLKVLKQYANFEGRARRTEYWMFSLFHIIAIMALAMIGGAFVDVNEPDSGLGLGILMIIYILGTFIPSLAVTVRRLHDIGKSGWYYFVSMVPFVGGIWLLILLVSDGDQGDNPWGPDPKNPSNEIDQMGINID